MAKAGAMKGVFKEMLEDYLRVVEKDAGKAGAKGTEKNAGKEAAEKALKEVKDTKVPKPKSKRTQYLGATPGKSSRTGREVIARMRNEGKIVGEPPKLRWTDPATGRTRLVDIKDCDMGHSPTNAVDWWNDTGYKYGPKSKEARDFMLDPAHYELQPSSWNRSEGAKLPGRYRDPS